MYTVYILDRPGQLDKLGAGTDRPAGYVYKLEHRASWILDKKLELWYATKKR